ncbi:MAG: hypothetical protein ABI705_03440 [Aestuariivirga sp.]
MTMTARNDHLSDPMPKLMSDDEVAERLGEAAELLTNDGEVGADNALKTLLDGELRIWDFLWRWKLQNLADRAAHVLGDTHRAIVLVRDVLNNPWPSGFDESPDDPDDT